MSERDTPTPGTPKLPSISATDILDAQDHSKLRRALVVLTMKIDKGFAGIHFFMVETRRTISTLAKDKEKDAQQLAGLAEQVRTLMEWKARQDGQAEVTGRHDIAKVVARDELQQEERKKQHEWRKASVPVKVAVISGFFGVVAGLLALITALLK